jgi:hypothetical protein
MMSCLEVEALAPDLALGLVSGDERADALTHIDTCRACRDLVDELSRAADAIVLLAPSVEPRADFEQRVMNALDGPLRQQPRRRDRVLAAAAAVLIALVAAATVGRITAGDRSDRTTADVAKATMLTPDAVAVGEVYVLHGEVGFVFVNVPRWSHGGDDYYVQLGLDDGTTAKLAASSVEGSAGTYAASIEDQRGTVVSVALLDAAGRVLCSAALPA